MSLPTTEKNLRVLIVDDNSAIHGDFRKILCPAKTEDEALDASAALLFGASATPETRLTFEVDSAYQGQEALALMEQALLAGRPYALAFVDVRMPPGWDGVETSIKLWEVCPDLQIVICTAYSDHSWDQMVARLKNSDRFLILKKPFDAIEVLQLACALTEKWRLQQAARQRMEGLEKLVEKRTKVLQETNLALQEEIVARQRATLELQHSEERYQLLFSKNPLPMWVVDRSSQNILAVNETAIRNYGYTGEEFCGMNFADLLLDGDVSSVLPQIGAAQKATSVTTRQRKKDGSIIDVEFISRLIVFDGRDARLLLANDITERKASEDRIQEQATLLDLAHEAILVRNLKGVIQFWSKGAEILFGWTAEEAIGQTTDHLFPLDPPTSAHSGENVLLEVGEWNGEISVHTRQNKELTLASRWTLLRDKEGKPKSVLVMNADITEKRKLEAQFLRSQRMEGMGTLATGMAHDLNNILAPILLSAGALRGKLSDEDRDKAISRIESCVKRGAGVIQQVLTFGRGVNGERVAVNPGELVQEVAKIVLETFPKGIALTREVPGDLWQITGDKTQLNQVLLNLCLNSRDAMPGGGKLKLRAANFIMDEQLAASFSPAQAGRYVLLEVTDTGTGIPAANLEKIFDPFFTTKDFGRGTGLGLSTVMGIVKSHDGVVTVESELSKGSTFKVYLPAAGGK